MKSVLQNGSGIWGARSRPAEYSRGTTPQAWTNDWRAPEGWLNSSRKAATFRATRAQVTIGVGPPS